MAPSGLSELAETAGCYGLEPRVTREAKERMTSELLYVARLLSLTAGSSPRFDCILGHPLG